ncbi:MAG: hypothetical protein HY918_03695 [Candidatus Doudnabacteria bacterium]|nr:hypothetical protein [Candidatus Doudnabacteria bacterium]
MKKVLVLLAAYVLMAPMALAAGSLGTWEKSVTVGQTLTVALNPSASARWFLPKLSITNPEVAVVSTKGTSLIIQGKKVGTTSFEVCTDLFNTNCLTVNVTVSPDVLGAYTSIVHQPGAWIINNGTVYYVVADGIIPVPTWEIFTSNTGRASMLQEANSEDLKLQMLPAMTLKDSRVK